MKSLQDKVKQELTRLWTGELAAVVSFWICFFTIKVWHENTKMLVSILYPLLVLSVILIQGSIYWLILLHRLSTPQFAITYTRKIYRVFKITDLLLICFGVPVIKLNYSNVAV